jgi:hypothetical protein
MDFPALDLMGTLHRLAEIALAHVTLADALALTGLGIEIRPGSFMGELGFVAPDVLSLSYEKLLELIFQSPEFGYYYARLTAGRPIAGLGFCLLVGGCPR